MVNAPEPTASAPTAHLAQVNIARLAAPIDSPQLTEFVAALDRINALGEASPGFVWRLVGDGNDATDLRAFPDPEVIVNLTVWTDQASLEAFTYRSDHTAFLRRRREWFTAPASASVALWHVPAGHRPSLGEARARVEHLTARGPSPYAFGFRGGAEQPCLTIARTPLDSALARELIGELNAELSSRYEPGNNHFTLHPEQVADGRGGFFVARLDGAPAGCGAVRLLDDGRAEVKRMYTRPAFAGRGLGSAMVSHLEGVARDLGAGSLVLETGTRQPEALRVYERAGFAVCDCWGEYLDTADTSVCMSKPLA